MISIGRGCGLLLFVSLSVGGCASGPQTLVGYKVPPRQQVAIVIDISDQVNEADQGGGVATLADTISERLKEAGIDSQLYTSKYDHPHPPRVDLFVQHWRGVPANSHAVGVLLPVPALAVWGPNSIVVDCSVTLPDRTKPSFVQRFEKTSLFVSNANENSANAPAESAANAIADAILKRQ